MKLFHIINQGINGIMLLLVMAIMLVFVPDVTLHAQCDESLVDKAIEESGIDVIFMQDFNIKQLKKKSLKNTQIEHFDVRLKKGLTYRFNVQNAKEYEGKAILQLYMENLLLASTYNIENKVDEQVFDFICDETGKYQVLMSIMEGKKACATGIMSVVINDTLKIADIIDSNKVQNILYAGVDNFLDIAVSDIPNGKVEVSISRGTIKEDNGMYLIKVDNPGAVIIEVIAKDSLGDITETLKAPFDVRLPVLPSLSIDGQSGGLIQKEDIIRKNPELILKGGGTNLQYRIVEFSISKSQYSRGFKEKHTHYLNSTQLNLIRNLKNGDTFFIKDIILEGTNGIRYKIDPVGFIIREDRNSNTIRN
ncbi:MAG: GldM family protein [Bacteroidota bacterium]